MRVPNAFLLQCFLLTVLLTATHVAKAQVIVYPVLTSMPEHGFLPGKKFKFYPTLEQYDFGGHRIRIEIKDTRQSFPLKTIACSTVELTNTSEFEGSPGLTVVYNYFQQLFGAANLQIDTSAADTLHVNLEALDSRMIGAVSIRAHGLCQLTIGRNGIAKTYCIDITDKDKHSPIGKNAFVTRKTGTRIITSAAIREVIEAWMRGNVSIGTETEH